MLLGRLGGDPNKKTLLVYGHLDVQPALKEDGWDYEPFVVRRGKSREGLACLVQFVNEGGPCSKVACCKVDFHL